MEYSYDYTPSPEEFRELGKKEVKAFEKWFLSTFDDRMENFVSKVRSYEGYENWSGDFTYGSVELLSKWFYDRAQENVIVAKYIPLSEISENICFNTGVYLSIIILNEYPSMGWYFEANRKRSADYGQPAIGPICEGFHIDLTNGCKVSMIRILKNKGREHELLESFEIWFHEYKEWN